MDIDRLSALPEELLVEIVGRVDDTEKAAKTAVLSKQWRFLWTNLPSINLWNSGTDPDEMERFVAGVHTVFDARSKAPLEGFKVHIHYYDNCFDSDVDAWLEAAAESKVKYVNLYLECKSDESDRYTLPPAIYSHSPLTRLMLGFCNLAPPAAAVEWRSLTRLTIHDSELTQRAIDAIASGCPALRHLELHRCKGFNRLEIGCRSFHCLELRSCDGCDGGNELLEISAPHMRDLNVWMNPLRRILRLGDVSSLEKARIDLEEGVWGPIHGEKRISNNEKVFEKILMARSLVLGHGWIKKEVPSMMREQGWRIPESRVEELAIDDSFNAQNVSVVLAILESSPFLDTLIIRNSTSEKESMEWDPSVRADLNHDLSLLKNVRIEIHINEGFCGNQSFRLAQILLKRAPLLEKMVICRCLLANRRYFPHADSDQPSDELIKKLETLLVYPRSSQNAAVEFIDIVLSIMRLRGWRFPESRIKELKISDAYQEEVYDALTIIQFSPFLERLRVENSIYEEESMKWDPNVLADLDHDLSHLKTVQIAICVHPEFSGELLFTLAQIMLKRAPSLEKMAIRVSTRSRSDELIKKFQTLLTYPRSSKKAVLDISSSRTFDTIIGAYL